MADRGFSYDTDYPAPEMVSEVAKVLAWQVDKSAWDQIIETYKSVLSFCEGEFTLF
ncbi:hypothetical protein E2C01_093568 [Portunus trituberculatus]|uniref:Uncharacterized protein n=1 Tax=Portunus trituberculatus TaxID=210409 RepID=A0A5B7JJH6_PORTR|nr:hypothetical protein [Portunus trituberculatus]